MRILVTGGAGFIGSNFVDYILMNQFRSEQISSLTILDNLTYAGTLENLNHLNSDPKFKFVKGDICDDQLVRDLLIDIDWVVNFAAESHVDRSLENPNEFVRSNVLGTATLLNAALQVGVKHFLQVSTDEVYGTIETGSWDESSILSPRSPYSASKASADLISNSFFVSHQMDVRITRCSNNYGPRQNLEKMIPKIIYNLKNNIPIPLYGDGLNIRDWLFVDDHCKGIWLTMQKGAAGETYHLGGGIELTNLDLILQIASYLEIENPAFNYVTDRKGHDFRYSLDFNKAKKMLGYEPDFTFQTGIIATLESYG